MDVLARNILKHPDIPARMEAVEEHTKKYLESTNARKANEVITIPVVVHIVYNDSTENISDAQILTQIEVLNEDFRLTNTDADDVWSQAADVEIEFCLASFDPDGNPTNAITRTTTSLSTFDLYDTMKFNSTGGKDAWPTGDYLNIWVCKLDNLLGYAQFPNGGRPETDGVVIDYRAMGKMGTAAAPFDLGRTATHEVGHWLNLFHIWGDGGCDIDDKVADTPLSDAENLGCAIGHVSCGTVDMVQNYMDYSDDLCMNLFTQGQKNRMRSMFDPGAPRSSLLYSTACGGGIIATCSDGVLNQGETGIDCGGPCTACPSECNDIEVNISIVFDTYPQEIRWQITNSDGTYFALSDSYSDQPPSSILNNTVCLPAGCYDFTLFDSYGDGLCCNEGSGSYSVTSDGILLASGDSFTSSETTNFCLVGATPTCFDGIHNQDETGVDCGGVCTTPCGPEEIALSLKVLLQGPAEKVGDLWKMKDDLRSQNLIPTTEPYTQLQGFNHIESGGETVKNTALNSTGDEAIIDWVFIELRESTNFNVIATKAALLKRDGKIISEDGTTLPTFLVEDGSYYVSIRHRNHLGVMTQDPIIFSSGNISEFDFTSISQQTYGTNARIDIGGSMAMWAGNADGGNYVVFQGGNNDVNTIIFEVLSASDNVSNSSNYVYTNYNIGDINLNGDSVYQGNDTDTNIIFFNILSHPANTNSSLNFIIQEQLP